MAVSRDIREGLFEGVAEGFVGVGFWEGAGVWLAVGGGGVVGVFLEWPCCSEIFYYLI